jgi:hypothetical protein
MFAFFEVYDLTVWIMLFSTLSLFLFIGCLSYWFGFKRSESKKKVGNVSLFGFFAFE